MGSLGPHGPQGPVGPSKLCRTDGRCLQRFSPITNWRFFDSPYILAPLWLPFWPSPKHWDQVYLLGKCLSNVDLFCKNSSLPVWFPAIPPGSCTEFRRGHAEMPPSL